MKPSDTIGYAFKGIPRELWARAKGRAVSEAVTMRELLIKALTAYLNIAPEGDESKGENK